MARAGRRGARARGGGARVSVGDARRDERGGGAGEHRGVDPGDRGGDRPAAGGWHTRAPATPRTRELLVEYGFLYDSDAYDDDLPYFVEVGGKRHLVLPYAFDTNDMHFQHSDRFTTAESFATYVTDAYDCLWREGERWPRMMSIGLHLRMIGRPGGSGRSRGSSTTSRAGAAGSRRASRSPDSGASAPAPRPALLRADPRRLHDPRRVVHLGADEAIELGGRHTHRLGADVGEALAQGRTPRPRTVRGDST